VVDAGLGQLAEALTICAPTLIETIGVIRSWAA